MPWKKRGDVERMSSGKKQKREQDRVDTALVIGAGIGIILGIICVISLIICLGADGIRLTQVGQLEFILSLL